MTPTPGTAQLPPRPVTYPGSGAPVGHRLGAGVITAIIAAVVVLAGVVTAVLVLPGSHAPKPVVPKPPGGSGQISASERPAAPNGPKAAAPSNEITVADIPITLDSGWDLFDRYGSDVMLRDNDDTAMLLISINDVDVQNVQDVTQVLEAWANVRSKKRFDTKASLEEPQELDSKRFQLAQAATYTADMSTQSGTTTVYGLFMVLVNTSTGRVAGIDMMAGTVEDFEAKWPGARTMIESML